MPGLDKRSRETLIWPFFTGLKFLVCLTSTRLPELPARLVLNNTTHSKIYGSIQPLMLTELIMSWMVYLKHDNYACI